ncbi:MAG: hypothetical protein AAB871_02995 [Patescibacteria group bacterium]
MNEQLQQPNTSVVPQTKNHKSLIIGLVVIVLLLSAAMVYLLTKLPTIAPTNINSQFPAASDEKESALSALKDHWAEFSNTFTVKPVLGATEWGYTGVQFISNDTFFIQFEDGHVGHIAVVKYQNDSLKLLDLLKDKSTLDSQEYDSFLKQYGDPSYKVSNYTISIFRNGEILSFDTLTPVRENIILMEGVAADWKTYKNDKYGFEIKYPSDYKIAPLPELDEYWKSKGLEYLMNVKQAQANASIQIYTQGQFDLDRVMREYAPTGLQDILPVVKVIGQNTFYYYGPGGGGVEYPDQYFYNLAGKLLVTNFDGPYENDKTPSNAAKQMEIQMLGTFKFTN